MLLVTSSLQVILKLRSIFLRGPRKLESIDSTFCLGVMLMGDMHRQGMLNYALIFKNYKFLNENFFPERCYKVLILWNEGKKFESTWHRILSKVSLFMTCLVDSIQVGPSRQKRINMMQPQKFPIFLPKKEIHIFHPKSIGLNFF